MPSLVKHHQVLQLMAYEQPPDADTPPQYQFVVKNPGKPGLSDLHITLPAGATVSDVKAKIQLDYELHPEPANQTVLLPCSSCCCAINLHLENP